MKKLTKKQNKILHIIIIILLLVVALLVGMVIGAAYNTMLIPLRYYPDDKCEGIEHFYTNTSFWNDGFNLVDYVKWEKTQGIVKPIDLWNNHTADCESISFAVMCLSELYNETCVYYTKTQYDPTENQTYMGHLGIKCKLGSEWLKVY